MRTSSRLRAASHALRSLLCAALLATTASTAMAEPASKPYDRIAPALAAALPAKSDVILLMLPDGFAADATDHLAAAMRGTSVNPSAAPDRILVVLRYSAAGASAANAELNAVADRLEVRKLPSAFVLDHKGLPVAQLVDIESSAAATLGNQVRAAHQRRVRRDALLEQARAAEGDAKARLLGAALEEVAPFAMTAYGELTRQAVELDADGELGLRERYGPGIAQKTVDRGIQEEVYPLVDQGLYEPARDRLKQLERTHGLTLDQRQLLRAFAAQLLYTLGQREEALTELYAAMALAPRSPAAERIRAAITQMTAPATP